MVLSERHIQQFCMKADQVLFSGFGTDMEIRKFDLSETGRVYDFCIRLSVCKFFIGHGDPYQVKCMVGIRVYPLDNVISVFRGNDL